MSKLAKLREQVAKIDNRLVLHERMVGVREQLVD